MHKSCSHPKRVGNEVRLSHTHQSSCICSLRACVGHKEPSHKSLIRGSVRWRHQEGSPSSRWNVIFFLLLHVGEVKKKKYNSLQLWVFCPSHTPAPMVSWKGTSKNWALTGKQEATENHSVLEEFQYQGHGPRPLACAGDGHDSPGTRIGGGAVRFNASVTRTPLVRKSSYMGTVAKQITQF